MPALRIISISPVLLLDNHPRRNDPARLSTLRIVSPQPKIMVGPGTVTLSGTVKNADGVGLVGRSVRIYADQLMSVMLGHTYSGTGGAFSLSVPGGAGSRYVSVAQGEGSENAQVFINIVETA